jgi:hypothetical protein
MSREWRVSEMLRGGSRGRPESQSVSQYLSI